MRSFARLLLAVGMLGSVAFADEPPSKEKPDAPPAAWVERVAAKARPSVVVISVAGREGSAEGLGTGFVVSAAGLIATNLHVIGEARPIKVRTAEGRQLEVLAVEATDRAHDLALLRVRATDLTPLVLGDSTKVQLGQPVVALGNPHGLEHSVVSGVISGEREIEGLPVLQLAIPIEPGNSGGPLVDDAGRVLGLLTMKSAVTANLGFAVKIDALKPLLAKPNPVPIDRWLTIGVLDAAHWQTLGGAHWRQRAGHLKVDGTGGGFGGRALCLSKDDPPKLPYELEASVKLDDESGAAGLVFAADGGDRHFGFYPSAGRLRLSRFEGPDVLAWQVLREESSPHYRAGQWNLLKVRLEKDRVRCWVNDQLVIEEPLEGEPAGAVGLAKFRRTVAEFKHFRVGAELPGIAPAPEVLRRVRAEVADLEKHGVTTPAAVDALAKTSPAAAIEALRARSRELEQLARRLDDAATRVHQRDTLDKLAAALVADDARIDLATAALLVARLDNDELDVAAYRQEIERRAKSIAKGLDKDAGDDDRLAALNRYLFVENGFHGSRNDYYNRSNSYLNEVLDDREGLPITLSVLYLELGRQLGIKLEGVALPGHFMVRFVPHEGDPRLIDVFEAGQVVSRDEAAQRMLATSGAILEDRHLVAVSKRAIIERMLENLLSIATDDEDTDDMLRYVDALVVVVPDSASRRLMRALLLQRQQRFEEALADTRWLLDRQPEEIDQERLLQLHQSIEQALADRRGS